MDGKKETRQIIPLTCHTCGSQLVPKRGYYLVRTLICPNPDCPDKKQPPAHGW